MGDNKYRELHGIGLWIVIVFTWSGLAAALFYVFGLHISGMLMIQSAYLALLLGLFLPITFFMFPATRKSPLDKIPWYDFLLAGLSLLGPALVFIYALPLTDSLWQVRPPPIPLALGLLTWVLILEAARRVIGWIFVLIAAIISIYPMFASFLPSVLYAKNYSLSRIAGFHFLSTQSIFGIPMTIFGSILIGFLVFGEVMEVSGASKFLLNSAKGLMGRLTGGPALIAVTASAFMASLSGSSVANVVTVGTITIPAMKKSGIESHLAAAIESVASNGGPITPPIMGATAFVMAGILQISYAAVCLAAAIPMLIYFICIFAQIYLHCKKIGIKPSDPADIPSLITTFKTGWFYLGSVAVLLFLMFWIKVEAWAPYFASVFLIFCAWFRKETRPDLTTLRRFTISLGRLLAFMVVTLSAVGLIMGSLLLTGVALSLSSELVTLSGGNLFLLLVLGAAAAFVLGMGMTSTPVYIFTALLFAPSLIKLGVYPMAAHFFFLYWANLSFITPPVCPTVYVASGIANSGVMKTGFTAVKLAIVLFILPFIIVLNPALITFGSLPQVVWSIVATIAGSILFAVALEGYAFRIGSIKPLLRIPTFCLGIVLVIIPLIFRL